MSDAFRCTRCGKFCAGQPYDEFNIRKHGFDVFGHRRSQKVELCKACHHNTERFLKL